MSFGSYSFFGYEGRCGAPTLFDAEYTYNLGLVAGNLCLQEKTGYMAAITDLDKGGRAIAVPLTALVHFEMREGAPQAVIQKALVSPQSPAFQYFKSRRGSWQIDDLFASPGPRQYFGKTAAQLPMTVALNQGYSSLRYQF